MVSAACLLMTLAIAAAPAPQVASAPPAAAVNPAACVPDDAVAAFRIRVPGLMASDLWKKTLGGESGLYLKLLQDSPLAIDPEKDVAEVVIAVGVRFQEGRSQDVRFASAWILSRDIDAKDFFKAPMQEVALEGFSCPVYAMGPDVFLARPSLRMAVLGTPEYLRTMTAALKGAPPTSPGAVYWSKLLNQPGELVAAYRVSEDIKAQLRSAVQGARQGLQNADMTPQRVNTFIGMDFIIRLGLALEHATLVVDLSREADPVRLALKFDSEDPAAFIGSGLNLLAPSLTEVSGVATKKQAAAAATSAPTPAEEEPLYRATWQGKEARIAVNRQSLDRLILVPAGAVSGARRDAAVISSMNNLKQMTMSCHQWAVSHRQKFPPSLKVVADVAGLPPELFENPALQEHFPDGDYVLVPVPSMTFAPDAAKCILLYERYPAGQEPPTIGAAFVDGHVERLPLEAFQKALAETQGLLRPQP